jgi:16S rRNA (adenine1518-N6/adenine1519-N6)-dimethyltransferase
MPGTCQYRAKKRFSQHFLHDKRIAARIIDSADIEGETVIEIGAGKGILTRLISERAARVYAVEIDRDLINILKEMGLKNMILINDDFLNIDLAQYKRPVVIGNIPYSITGRIIERLAQSKRSFKRAVLTIQQEYGERLLAGTGSGQYGPVSLFCEYYFTVEKEFTIRAGSFSPQPKVSSTVIKLTPRKKPFTLLDEKGFFEMIRGIFQYRRKFIKNALVNYLHERSVNIAEAVLRKRPADLSLHDYYSLFKAIGCA